MPTYDFTCKDCCKTTTFIVPYGEYANINKTCPACNGNLIRSYGGLKDILIKFKGSGWAGKDLSKNE